MNGVEVLQSAFNGAHGWYEGTVADVTHEQANEVPPGVTHPIAELMAHILHSEDGMINMMIRGEASIWDRDGWGEKLGLPMMLGQETATARAYICDPQALTEYGQSVFANTDAYLGSLTDADLHGEIDLSAMGMPKMPLGQFLTGMLLGNTYAHTGEISALKGLMGNKGYPF